MKNYIQIVSLDLGLIPFKMYDFQEHIVRTIHDNRFTYVNYRDNQVNQQRGFLSFTLCII